MSLEAFIEHPESRAIDVGGKTVQLTTKWVTFYSDDEVEVYAAALLETPPVYRGLVRSRINPVPQKGGLWYVEVDYEPLAFGQGVDASGAGLGPDAGTPGQEQAQTAPGLDDPLGPGYALEITANTAHITTSVFTRYRRTPADDPTNATKKGSGPRFGSAIGVSADGVAGCDVVIPSATLTVTTGRGKLTIGDIKALIGMVGKTNDNTFYNFAAGEVLYMGCSLQSQGGRWTEAHKFGISPNRTNVSIGGTAPVAWAAATAYLAGDEVSSGGNVYTCLTAGTSAGSGGPTGTAVSGIADGSAVWGYSGPAPVVLPAVAGWEYVWSYFSPGQLAAAVVAPVLVSVNVEQVYRSDNFSAIGIGT